MNKQVLFTPCCICCGSFFCDTSLFCKTCFQEKIKPLTFFKAQSHIPNQEHHYLFSWELNSAEYFDQFVYRLKGDQAELAWKIYAKIFYEVCLKKIDHHKYDCFVPVPSTRKHPDHAQYFAVQLSKLTGIPVRSALMKKPDVLEQKHKNILQRQIGSSFVLSSKEHEQITRCILVDDVVTTGNSYFHCKRALSSLESSLIYSLFYRPKSSLL